MDKDDLISRGMVQAVMVMGNEQGSGDEEEDTRLVIDEEDQYGCMEDLPHLTLPSESSLPQCSNTTSGRTTQRVISIKTEVLESLDEDIDSHMSLGTPIARTEQLPMSLSIKQEVSLNSSAKAVDSSETQNNMIFEKSLQVPDSDYLSDGTEDSYLSDSSIPLTSMLPCPKCPRKFARKVNLVAHIRGHKSGMKFICHHCGEGFQKKRLYSFHVYCHTNQMYECYECGRKFVHKKSLLNHQREHELKNMAIESERNLNPSKHLEARNLASSSGFWALKCTKCGKISSTQHEYDKHMNMLCKDDTDTLNKKEMSCKDEFDNHLAAIREGNRLKYGRKFIHRKYVRPNQGTNQNQTSGSGSVKRRDPSKDFELCNLATQSGYWALRCKKCGLVTSSQDELDKHMNMQCKVESDTLDDAEEMSCRDELDFHLASIRAEKPPECGKCRQKFDSSHDLYEHGLAHCGKPVSCHICDEVFIKEEELELHMALHKIPNRCPTCKKLFASHKNLAKHFIKFPKHDKDEANQMASLVDKSLNKQEDVPVTPPTLADKKNDIFVCHKCGEVYYDKQILLDHLSMHFQCRKCKKTFTNQKALDLHILFLGDKQIMSCCICGNLLHGKKELERHLSDHVTAEYQSTKNSSEWEEKTLKIQKMIGNMNQEVAVSIPSSLIIEEADINKIGKSVTNFITPGSKSDKDSEWQDQPAQIEPVEGDVDEDLEEPIAVPIRIDKRLDDQLKINTNNMPNHSMKEDQSNVNSESKQQARGSKSPVVDINKQAIFKVPAKLDKKAKINKVKATGENLRCSECSKIVRHHHSLQDQMNPDTEEDKSGDDYVLISRLVSPQSMYQKNSYCACSNSADKLLVRAAGNSQKRHRDHDGEDSPVKLVSGNRIGSYFSSVGPGHSDIDKSCASISQKQNWIELGTKDTSPSLAEFYSEEGEISAELESGIVIKIGREVGPDMIQLYKNAEADMEKAKSESERLVLEKSQLVSRIVVHKMKKSNSKTLPKKTVVPVTKKLPEKVIVKKEQNTPDVFIKEEWDFDY